MRKGPFSEAEPVMRFKRMRFSQCWLVDWKTSSGQGGSLHSRRRLGQCNSVRGGSFIGGGYANTIFTNDIFSAIPGGLSNSILPNASYCFLGGGLFNTNSAAFSV